MPRRRLVERRLPRRLREAPVARRAADHWDGSEAGGIVQRGCLPSKNGRYDHALGGRRLCASLVCPRFAPLSILVSWGSATWLATHPSRPCVPLLGGGGGMVCNGRGREEIGKE